MTQVVVKWDSIHYSLILNPKMCVVFLSGDPFIKDDTKDCSSEKLCSPLIILSFLCLHLAHDDKFARDQNSQYCWS